MAQLITKQATHLNNISTGVPQRAESTQLPFENKDEKEAVYLGLLD